MKKVIIVLFLILTSFTAFYAQKAKDTTDAKTAENKKEPEKIKIQIPEPKAGMRESNINIKQWNPPTSLKTHFGHGSNAKNAPIFYFNLNLGYLRLFMKSDAVKDDTYLFNSNFSYIIELRPLDFISFLSSGSRFAIFMEQNEYLRNLTLILSNKTFSSTQFITSEMLWYFDFLYNAINIKNIIIPQSRTSPSALENLYPVTRKESIGLSDRLHIFQSPRLAIGLAFYFESHIPTGTQKVAKGPLSGTLTNLYSSSFTYSTLGGVFLRYKNNPIEMHANILYQWMEGDFDDWVITVQQNTLSAHYEISLYERYFGHANYYLINWKSNEQKETVYSHTINVGGEIKGFGKMLEWVGIGLDLIYQNMTQARGVIYDGKFSGYGFAVPVTWYPLSFHSKNHKLKLTAIYGLIKYDWNKSLYNGAIPENGKGWADSIMIKADYEF
ncbi:MAG: hypothetical protein OEV44_10960 [Spirochaetota bacterium]|nr:hypothetical protein [Spirochaetota bacterium]